jgi:mono/diheme cytochrome c family protein
VAGEDDAAEVARVTEQGEGGMPGFSGDLSAAQIQAVAEYVTTQLQ